MLVAAVHHNYLGNRNDDTSLYQYFQHNIGFRWLQEGINIILIDI